MTDSTYHALKVGTLDCYVIADMAQGTITPQKLAMRYPKVPDAEVIAAIETSGPAKDMTGGELNTLVIKSGDTRLLMDTGMGPNHGENMGCQLENLKAAGIAAADIDIVLITHFHPDHTFGLLDADGNPAFPNARYLCSETEMNWWFGEDVITSMWADSVGPIRQSVAPLKDRFELLGPDAEVLPGVRIMEMFGHSPGHIGLLLESEGKKLLNVVDLLHGTVQFANPDWHHVFDDAPDQAVETRRAMLGKAADENLLTAFYHMPFPGLGHVTRDGDAFKYTPLTE